MKVMFCSSGLSYQGDAVYATRMRANAMVRAGLSVVVTGFPEKYPDNRRDHLFEYISVQSVWSSAERRRFNWLKSHLGNYGTFLLEPWCVMQTAYQMARERGMEIMYLSHLEPCVLWPLIHVLKLRRSWLPTAGMMPGLFYNYDAPATRMYPWRTRVRAWLNDRLTRLLIHHMLVCCNSKYIPELMNMTDEPRLVVTQEGYETRRQGLDQRTARARLGIPMNKRMLLLFGAASKSKGADILLQALEGIPPRFIVCIVGKTGGVYESSWPDAQHLYAAGWRDCLRIVNYVPDSVMEDYYAACDAVVIPYRKGFVTTSTHMHMAVEFGKAMIACDQYLIGELVRKYDLGLLFLPEDVKELRDCLTAVAEKPSEWFDQIRQNSMRLVEDFSWDKIGRPYLSLFETLLANYDK